jgi:hypothetical protein
MPPTCHHTSALLPTASLARRNKSLTAYTLCGPRWPLMVRNLPYNADRRKRFILSKLGRFLRSWSSWSSENDNHGKVS